MTAPGEGRRAFVPYLHLVTHELGASRVSRPVASSYGLAPGLDAAVRLEFDRQWERTLFGPFSKQPSGVNFDGPRKWRGRGR